MAKKDKVEKPAPAEAAAPTSRKVPVKAALILAGVLFLEGAVISTAFLLAGGPADAQANGPSPDLLAEYERPVEVLVVQDRFPNNKRGTTYIYDTRIFLVTRKKHEETITKQIQSMQAQISDDVRLIISQAEPSQLVEPTLATLKRQIRAALDQRLQPDEQGRSCIEEVLITKFIQIRASI